MPHLFEQAHKQWHITFPNEGHEDGAMMEYLRGFIHGVRFAKEYRKWARVIEYICYHTDGADAANPPRGLDDTARWLTELFGDDPPVGDALIEKLVNLRDVKDEGEREKVLPAVNTDGKLEWLPGEPVPFDWYIERWGDE